MANGLSPGQIDDLVTSTLHHLGKFKWTDISYNLQDHVAFRKLFKKDRVSFTGGESIDLNIKTGQGSQARWTGLYDDDDIEVQNLLDKGNIPWRFADTHMGWDAREQVFNRGAAEIVDYIRVRRQDAMTALAGLLEAAFWGKPTDSTGKEIFGLAYWMVRNATEGFNGGNPAGFSDCGGINSTQHPNWKNWTFQYAAVSQTDLCRKVRKACVKTKFKPPHAHPSYEGNNQRFAHYMNYDLLGPIEEYLESNNNDAVGLSKDFGKYAGTSVFRGVPLEYVPYLDADTTNPWLGVDWAVMSPVFQSGYWMKQSDPRDAPTNSHNTRAVYWDSILNLRCVNRRRLFIGYK